MAAPTHGVEPHTESPPQNFYVNRPGLLRDQLRSWPKKHVRFTGVPTIHEEPNKIFVTRTVARKAACYQSRTVRMRKPVQHKNSAPK